MAILTTNPLDLAFAALADPTRRAILSRLAEGEADVAELAAPFQLSQPAISKHLLVLEQAGLVLRGRDKQRRPRTLVSMPLQLVDNWMEPFRKQWGARFDRLDEFLDAPTEPLSPGLKGKRGPVSPISPAKRRSRK